MKKKEPQKCLKCAVELSWKELATGYCFVCDRDTFEKDKRQLESHGGLLREGQKWNYK